MLFVILRDTRGGGDCWAERYLLNGRSAAAIMEVNGTSTTISEPTDRGIILEIFNHLEIRIGISNIHLMIFSRGAFTTRAPETASVCHSKSLILSWKQLENKQNW